MQIAALALLLLLQPAAAEPPAPRADAPAPNCVDARSVTQMRQIAADVLLVASASTRHRISLHDACADAAIGASLLAKDGWVCGGGAREFVQTATLLCPIRAVEVVSARDYAQWSRAADMAAATAEDTTLLPAVESRGKRKALRGFRGSPEYCLRPSAVRSWSEDGGGLIVHTAKDRSGGNSNYRVDLGGNCPQLAYMSNLSLQSGVGLDLVCGNAGDVALLSREENAPSSGPQTADGEQIPVDRPLSSRLSHADTRGCAIVAVYPVDP